MDEQSMRLIAIGSSVSANCPACLEANLARARQLGAGEREIAAAIQVGRLVRRGAASKMDGVIKSLSGETDLKLVEGCNCP
jgi:AhpD family alkylhydroperoxidase